MEIKVNIERVLPVETGVSKSGNQWSKQTFIGVTNDKFPKKIAFIIMGDLIAQSNVQAGAYYNINFDIESRSFTDRNGVERWSTDAKAWRIEPAEAEAPQSVPVQQPVQQPTYSVPTSPQPQPQPQPQPSEDLPF